MPPLRVLGRDWHVSSDDLFLPAVFGVLFHGAWSIVLLWAYATAGLPDDCPELVRASKAGSAMLLAAFLLTTLLQLWLMVETMQGALLEEYKRRRVPLALYALFVGYACEAAALIVATNTLYESRKLHYADCYSDAEASRLATNPTTLSMALIWTTWSFFGAVMLLMLLLYNLYPDQNLDGWVGRVTCISRCFCCFGAMTHDTSDNKLERLAKVLGDLLAPLNFTFTDLACALMLVGITHRSKDTGRGSTAHMHAILSAMGHGMAQEVELRLSRHTTEQAGSGAEEGGTQVQELGTLDSLVVQGQMVQDLLLAQQRLLLEQASQQPQQQQASGAASKDSRVRFAAQQGLQTQHSDGKLSSLAEKQQPASVLRATSAPPNSSQLAAALATTLASNGGAQGDAAAGPSPGLPRSSSTAAGPPGMPGSGSNASAYSDVFLRAVKHAGMTGVGRPNIAREVSGISSSAGLGSDGDLPSAAASVGGEVSLELLQEALHWHKYALAIYGTVMFLWSKRHSCMNGLCCVTDDDDYWPEPNTNLLPASAPASQPVSAANSQPPSPTKASAAANGSLRSAAAVAAAPADIEQGGGGGSSGRVSALATEQAAAAAGGPGAPPPSSFLQRLRARWRGPESAGGSASDDDMSPRKSVLVSAAVTVDAKLDPAGQAAGAKQPAASAGSKVNDGVLPEMEPVRLQTQLMQLAITQMANIPASSLVYTNFSNVIEGLLPYMICVDHQKRSVVVAIRGSLSLEDVVTDVLYDPVPLDEDWLLGPDSSAAHSGQDDDNRDEEQEELEEQLQQHPEQQRLQQVNPAALTGAPARPHGHNAAAQTRSKQGQEQAVPESRQQALEAPAASAEEVLVEPAQQQQQEQEQEQEQEDEQQEQRQPSVSLQRLPSTSSMKASPFTTAHDAAAAAAVGFDSQAPHSNSSSKPGMPSRLQQRSQPGDPAGGLRASQSVVSYDPAAAYVPGVATAPPPTQDMHRHQQGHTAAGGGSTLHSLMSERGTTTSSSRQRRQEASDAAAQAAAAAAVAALHTHSMLLRPSDQGLSQPQPSQQPVLQHQASTRPERRLLHQASSKILGAFSITQQPSRVSTVPSLPPKQESAGDLEEGGPGRDPELLAADRRAAEVEARASEYRPDVGSAGGGWYAHEGIYRCARAIRADLRRHQLLDALLLGEGGGAGGSLPDCSGYDLLITGHSLGAGVAALLALHYRQVYPGRVRCWTFAPPGGLLSPGASDSLQDICYSLVTSKDMIPRMSLWSMERLRDEMMFCALRCKVSKRRLIGRAAWALLGGRFWSEREVLWPLAKLPEEACRQYRQYRDAMVSMRSLDPPRVRIAREFVPPGRIIWLEKVKVTFPPRPSSSSSMQPGAVSTTSAMFRSLFSNPGSNPASSAATPHGNGAAAGGGPQEDQRVQEEADIVERLGGGAVALEAVAAEVSGDAGSDTASGGGSAGSGERLRVTRRHPRVRTRLLPCRSSSVAMITEGMVVSRSMFSDHLPDTQYEWLKRLVRQLERAQGKSGGNLSMQNSCNDLVGTSGRE